MSKIELGVAPDSGAKRDAIHVAVAPVEAGEELSPGQRVGLRYGVARHNAPHVGIVDPFSDGPVLKGQRFWLVLFPNTVKNLRHDWDHDSLPNPGSDEEEVDNGCRGC